MSHPKHASADHDILDVIRHRWSPRAFDPAKDVSPADLFRVFEAARWAPSSFNEQPWRFVVADRRRTPDAFAGLLDALEPFNREWAQHAPVLVLTVVSTHLQRTGHPNRSAYYDVGQAVGFLTLQATGMGLGVRQMEGFRADAAREICRVPAEFEVVIAMAIGYAGDPETLSAERHRAAERQPRRRQATVSFVFEGEWGRTMAAP